MDWLNEDTWIISDTHLFHDNIIEYTNRPLNHDELIIYAWNTMVKPEDNLLHLGDVILAPTRIILDIAPLLTGNKYLIKGNHDSRRKMRNHLNFNILDRKILNWKNGQTYRYVPCEKYGVIFSHEPLPTQFLRRKHVVNIHGHIHNNLTLDNMHINMSVEVRNYQPCKFGEVLKEIDETYGLQKLNTKS